MKRIIRRLLIGIAVAALAAPGIAAAPQAADRYVWAQAWSGSDVWVSDSVGEMRPDRRGVPDSGPLEDRWRRALNREDISAGNTAIGTRGDVSYDNRAEAEDDRVQFINSERRRGRTVRVVPW